MADGYVTFVRHSQDMLRDKVNEEVYIERLFDVSKMPSPPHKKWRDPPKCGKTTGQGGISPIWRPGNVFQPGRRGFSDPRFFLYFLFLSVSLLSLDLSYCPLHSGLHCHSAFGSLSIKKGNFYSQRVHKSILKKDYLKQCSLEVTYP